MNVHILASALLTPETRLWTHDKRLAHIAGELMFAYEHTLSAYRAPGHSGRLVTELPDCATLPVDIAEHSRGEVALGDVGNRPGEGVGPVEGPLE